MIRDITVYFSHPCSKAIGTLLSKTITTVTAPAASHFITRDSILSSSETNNNNNNNNNNSLLFLKQFITEDENVFTEVQHPVPWGERVSVMIVVEDRRNNNNNNNFSSSLDGSLVYAIHQRQMAVLRIVVVSTAEEGKDENKIKDKIEKEKRTMIEKYLLTTAVVGEETLNNNNDEFSDEVIQSIQKEITDFFSIFSFSENNNNNNKKNKYISIESDLFLNPFSSSLDSFPKKSFYHLCQEALLSLASEYNNNHHHHEDNNNNNVLLIIREDGLPFHTASYAPDGTSSVLPLKESKFYLLRQKIFSIRESLQNNNNNNTKEVEEEINNIIKTVNNSNDNDNNGEALSRDLFLKIPLINGSLGVLDRYCNRNLLKYIWMTHHPSSSSSNNNNNNTIVLMLNHFSSIANSVVSALSVNPSPSSSLETQNENNNNNNNVPIEKVIESLEALVKFEYHWLDLPLPDHCIGFTSNHNNNNNNNNDASSLSSSSGWISLLGERIKEVDHLPSYTLHSINNDNNDNDETVKETMKRQLRTVLEPFVMSPPPQ